MNTAMDSRSNSSESGPVTRELLAAVSRSFYLSLRVLPGPVRHPLSLSYLLARATDTVAGAAAGWAVENSTWGRETGFSVAAICAK